MFEKQMDDTYRHVIEAYDFYWMNVDASKGTSKGKVKTDPKDVEDTGRRVREDLHGNINERNEDKDSIHHVPARLQIRMPTVHETHSHHLQHQHQTQMRDMRALCLCMTFQPDFN